ncbi:LacI family DNA-binding transcriptional regulator [Paracoccus aurantiacus]|uniref:LacI family DNA-binding transcriptional regulator n=1 Tax=Paracoccus aurantiacus TaxID=2599412 RepID=A0A5C6RMW8_9RHOB|nr:LacI family DNA-binding transcriptional regulator [Paracoccus aurantiacus]TXB63656.1 LacI family DNA-binding transcriptional regulator [Paracoccus aurantiacus]
MTRKGAVSPKRPTIYDLAQIAGASPSAVSSILNGSWKRRRISAATAERVIRIAQEQGYAINLQASMLRRERSHIVGMIVPKYDNRYFGAIAEQFETMARARGLFPVITCTQRDPELEFDAARELVSYQAETIVVTGATEPDRISEFCAAAGVRTINLDLPGQKAPSVLSDNFGGARDLTRLLIQRVTEDFGNAPPLWFVGGRPHDHNTTERLRGFRAALAEAQLDFAAERVLMPGYSPSKALAAMEQADFPAKIGIFVNSTIALEGVVRWLNDHKHRTDARFGCFDWDPFAALLAQNVGMTEQDVPGMLNRLFDIVTSPGDQFPARIEVPCILKPLLHG